MKAALLKFGSNTKDDPLAWAHSSYKPTPTIVEAAQALCRGHDVHEISCSEAGAENLSRTAAYIAEVIEQAKRERRKAICFVTGVPGSGKTLAGLNLATERMRSQRKSTRCSFPGMHRWSRFSAKPWLRMKSNAVGRQASKSARRTPNVTPVPSFKTSTISVTSMSETKQYRPNAW